MEVKLSDLKPAARKKFEQEIKELKHGVWAEQALKEKCIIIVADTDRSSYTLDWK